MSIPPWPRLRKSLPSVVQSVFQGVNRLNGFSISDNYSTDIKNMTTASYPALSVRPGFSLAGIARAARILGLGAHKDTELQTISNGEWWSLVSGTWTSRTTGLSTSANWSFANFKGGFSDIYLVGSNGVDAVKVYNGSTVSNLSGAPTSAKFIETYADRLWCVTDGNRLNFSEYRVGTNWTTIIESDSDPGFITVETNDGETISGIISGPKRLVIFKPNSIFNLFGDYAESFTLNRVTGDIGALSDQSITTINGTIYFVHTTGVYEYSGGTSPDKQFSEPVQEYIDRINPAAASKVCAGTDGIMLYIGLPLDSATEPDTILEFNTRFGTWSVWKDYAPLNITNISKTAYIGGVEGQIRQVGGSTSDNGSAINWYVISKPYTSPSMSQRTMWKRAWLTSKIPLNSTLQVSLSKSPTADDFTLVQNIPVETVVSGSRIIIPTTTAAFANYIRYKLSGSGPADLIEMSWESEDLPIY